jgi:hypothetical protein
MKDNSKLAAYARDELGGGAAYEGYRPDIRVLERIRERLPRARVEVVAAAWCKDCRREVPRLARIVERLPGWTAELLGDDPETRRALGVVKIPTIVVRNVDSGEELGRIVESPDSGSIEDDLLRIAERHPTRLMA